MFGYYKKKITMDALIWHYHENCFEFTIPYKGNFIYSTPEKDYSFSGGDVFISYPNEIHGTNENPLAIGNLYWFQLDISDTDNFLFLKPEAARELISALWNLSRHVITIDLHQVYPLLEKAFQYGQNPSTAPLAASYLQLFLQMLPFFEEKEANFISSEIKFAQNYICTHIAEDISLENLASLCGLSISQFMEKFKKQTGITPRHYINQSKIECAKTLLLQGHTITETAMLLNYSTSNYFSTVFKKYTMYTPSEFLQKNRHSEMHIL